MFVRPTAAEGFEEWRAAQEQNWGYEPNYAAVFASRPEVAKAWSALGAAVSGGMDRRRFEIATIAAARALRSTYCTAAHTKFLRDVCGDEAGMRSISLDPAGEGLDDVDRAVMVFADLVARDASAVRAEEADALRAVGLTDDDIADIVFAVGARAFFTTVLDACGVQADHQLADVLDPDVRRSVTVGRPIADAPAD